MAVTAVPSWDEFILETVTNIAMGTEIDNHHQFEEGLDMPLGRNAKTESRPRRRNAADAVEWRKALMPQ